MKRLLAMLLVVLVACGGGNGGTSHAVAACHASADAVTAWHHYLDVTRGTFTRDEMTAADNDIAAADQRMTSEAAQAAASDSKWDTLNRALATIAKQNRNGGDVDVTVNATVNAECGKASAS